MNSDIYGMAAYYDAVGYLKLIAEEVDRLGRGWCNVCVDKDGKVYLHDEMTGMGETIHEYSDIQDACERLSRKVREALR